MQPLSSCADSSNAYALQKSSECKCFLGLLVQMAVLQVMADCGSSAAALVWSKWRIEDLHQCFVNLYCSGDCMRLMYTVC